MSARPGRADEFSASGESSLAQYTQDTLVIHEDQPEVRPSWYRRSVAWSASWPVVGGPVVKFVSALGRAFCVKLLCV